MAGEHLKEPWAPGRGGAQGLTHPFSRHLACREGQFSQIWAIYPCGKYLFQFWGKSNIIYSSLLMPPAAAASPGAFWEPPLCKTAARNPQFSLANLPSLTPFASRTWSHLTLIKKT